MPNLLAHDIIGVQPMTGPVGQIFTLNAQYYRGPPYYTDHDLMFEQAIWNEIEGFLSPFDLAVDYFKTTGRFYK